MEILLWFLGVLLGGITGWYISHRYAKKGSEDTAALAATILRNQLKQNYEGIIDLVLKSDSQDDWISISPGSVGKDQWVSYRPDVRIHFRTSHDKQCDDFRADWANRHPDKHAVGYWLYLYFDTIPIKEFILVSVDGGRGTVPPPRLGNGKISPLDYKMAQVAGNIDTLDEYIEQSGLEVAESAPI